MFSCLPWESTLFNTTSRNSSEKNKLFNIWHKHKSITNFFPFTDMWTNCYELVKIRVFCKTNPVYNDKC